MCFRIPCRWLLSLLAFYSAVAAGADAPNEQGLAIEWKDRFLTISGDFPGGKIRIHYLEAYCRPGSTDRDWAETVIPHETLLVESDASRRRIRLRDRLSDGVAVEHVIIAHADEVEFQLAAHNRTAIASQVHWAQPCIRVDGFTGCSTRDARSNVPNYVRQCFVFVDGRLTRLPTQPWAEVARYVPGQVYRAPLIDADDVNPRPLSVLVPSHGLIGCFSEDQRKIMAVAWQPYQELFQGVITCIHSDFHIGGLEPGESKTVRGKIYIVDADPEALLQRYQRDFPEQPKSQGADNNERKGADGSASNLKHE